MILTRFAPELMRTAMALLPPASGCAARMSGPGMRPGIRKIPTMLRIWLCSGSWRVSVSPVCKLAFSAKLLERMASPRCRAERPEISRLCRCAVGGLVLYRHTPCRVMPTPIWQGYAWLMPSCAEICATEWGHSSMTSSGRHAFTPVSISRTMPSMTPLTTIWSMNPRAMPPTHTSVISRCAPLLGQRRCSARYKGYARLPTEAICHSLPCEVNFLLQRRRCLWYSLGA